jgi:hypothetical protein
MPNDKEQCSLYLDHDLIVLADHEAGKLDLSRSQLFKRALCEYVARLHASSVCETLSQRRREKAK